MTTPAGLGLIEYIALGGTADGAKTDTSGYAVGDTVITLAAFGSGKINAGQIIQFEADHRSYLVDVGLADVSVGGAITLKTPLRQAISSATTRIRTGNELRRSWGHTAYHTTSGYLDGNDPAFWHDWYDAGDVAQVWLDYSYSNLDHTHKDLRTESVASSGVVQVRDMGTQERFQFSQKFVTDVRGVGFASDADAFESFMDTAMKGSAFIWFPDFENYPDEFISCIMNKRAEPKRVQTLGWFDFNFDLRALPSVQIPSNSPAFI